WFTYADIRAALGCPTSQEAGLVITFQYYQNGWLWYVHGDGHWELLNPRTRVWGIYPDESSARAAAAAQLGAPITGPFIVHGTYQFYEGGSMVWTPVTDVVVFAHSGTWWDY
ncbi:MAG TPA: hypothetical protein VER55_08525, partial [Ardenticatenaceae bacterium]|nr:hypothetical protein [Ardenticatenaceae bacterium]